MRQRKKPRTRKLTTHRWPLYVKEIDWFNGVADYAYERGFSVSYLIISLLKAWELNEVEAGRKESKQ